MKRKKIRSSWKEYFNFSSRERRGAIFLSLILLVEIIVLFYQRSIHRELSPPDPEIIAALNRNLDENDSSAVESEIKVSKYINEKVEYFHFDPNSLERNSWLKLGLSEKQISVLENYKSKGGSFRIKNDLKKMYCITPEKFKELEPYINLPDSIIRKSFSPKVSIPRIIQIDIQEADSIQLMSLRGVGPVLAGRIIKYREKLGGFNSINQLKEVWGITDSLLTSLSQNIILRNDTPFRMVNLKSDSFPVLASHPYIKGKVAAIICNYRKQHAFKSLDELKQLPLLTEENFLKLAPYITIE